MKDKLTKPEKFLCSWAFFGLLILLQFIAMPVAAKNFSFAEAGNIVNYTLGRAFIQSLHPYTWIWQTVTIFFLCMAFALKGKFARSFMIFAGVSYLLYTVIQNVAVTERYGLSIVTGNVILMGLTAFVWFRDAVQGKTDLAFANLGKRTWWLLLPALFCLWWPLDMVAVKPSFDPALLFTGGSAMAYCAMTPVFLIILMLNKPDINLVTYRVTAMTGTIIGMWNMASFGDPRLMWLGIYHLPLLLLSVYALTDSWRIKKRYYV